MSSLSEEILKLLATANGRTDREITDVLRGHTANQQPVNAACRNLAAQGIIHRRKRSDGLIGNFLSGKDNGKTDTLSGAVLTEAPEVSQAEAAGDSPEQRAAEVLLIEGLSKKLGVTLEKKELQLPDGGRLELDGFSNSPPIACEAWSHIGPAKSAQKNKLMTDAFKLVFASRFLPKGTRRILVMADPQAARHLQGRGWMGQALKANDIELQFIDLPQETVGLVRSAQKRQYR